jgi:N-methylhydantoinase A/oxoprolinase/acetone carboxylase beta subunit
LIRRIGVDVGGTNTDAVLLDGGHVAQTVKTPTTPDVTSGIVTALDRLVRGWRAAGGDGVVDAVMIGTTAFTNAVVERRDLTRVAAVRIGLPASASLPPFVDWPDDLADLVRGEVAMLEGGHEYDGRQIVPFDAEGMVAAARRIAASGARSAAIASVFSPLNPECEDRAAAILAEECPGLAVTRSHDLGRIGLLERENAALLNACLVDLARRTTTAFEEALRASGIEAPLYLTANDGTVMLAAAAAALPVYSFASGPTNSMRGAALLSGEDEAIVVDVGGTTTDVGSLRHGFPREANNVVEIGGVRTLFRMPDLLSLGLGGGSLVVGDGSEVGPASVGYELTERALVFGGDETTMTDVAVSAGLIGLGTVAELPADIVERALATGRAIIAEGVDRMKSDARDVPLVAVGGGSFLVPDELPGISRVIRVPQAEVANAVGAAMAQVSGEVDQIFQGLERGEAIAAARRVAEERAVAAGGRRETLEVVEVEDLPIAYLPGASLRIRVRVVGDIA